MEGVYRALGGPWLIAAEVEVAIPPTDLVWNEHTTKLSHIVVSDRSMAEVGDVASVCGAVTSELSQWPDYRVCPVCVAGVTE